MPNVISGSQWPLLFYKLSRSIRASVCQPIQHERRAERHGARTCCEAVARILTAGRRAVVVVAGYAGVYLEGRVYEPVG